MATRQAKSTNKLDIHKPFPIVRELTELDTTEGLPLPVPKALEDVAAKATEAAATPATTAMGKGALNLASTQLAVSGLTAKKPKVKEIPVPQVKEVPTYTRDYLPTFRIPETYIRGRGGTNYGADDYVEYDLDNDDEDWLEALNRSGDNRLSDTKFERMLWRLELMWAESFEALPSERSNATALASIACMSKPKALRMLQWAVGGRDVILEAVYEYWAAKRRRTAKPLLKRLQAPTNPNDTNPYNVFRPREKVGRPLTRRRRENTAECLDKLRHIQGSLLKGLEMAELVILRERKKRDIQHVDMTLQRAQIAAHHGPPEARGAVEAEAAARLQELMARSAALDARISAYVEAQATQGGMLSLDSAFSIAMARKRARIDADKKASTAISKPEALPKLPPPLGPPELEPLCVYQPNLAEVLGPDLGSTAASSTSSTTSNNSSTSTTTRAALPAEVAADLASGKAQAYIGRGGRVVVARCNPLTLEPLAPVTPFTTGGSRQEAGGPAVNGVGPAGAGATTPGPATAPAAGGVQQAAGGSAASGAAANTSPAPPNAGAAGTATGAASEAPAAGGGTSSVAGAAAVVAGRATSPAPAGNPNPAAYYNWSQAADSMTDGILFPWRPPPSEPWAAVLDLSLMPAYIDRAPYLAQRAAFTSPPDYREHLVTVTGQLQAAQHPSYSGMPAANAAAPGAPGAHPGAAHQAAATQALQRPGAVPITIGGVLAGSAASVGTAGVGTQAPPDTVLAAPLMRGQGARIDGAAAAGRPREGTPGPGGSGSQSNPISAGLTPGSPLAPLLKGVGLTGAAAGGGLGSPSKVMLLGPGFGSVLGIASPRPKGAGLLGPAIKQETPATLGRPPKAPA